MSKVSIAIMNRLLEEITDYNGVTLSQDELNTLESKCYGWEDEDSIESEINQHLTKFGFKFNDDTFQWSREKLILPMNTATFIDFYYSDKSSSSLRSIAFDFINKLKNEGSINITVQELFNNCGYFHIGHLDISEELGNQLREAFQDEEIESISGVVLGKEYEIVLK